MSETNTNSSDFKLIQRLIRQKQKIPKKIFCGDAIELKMHGNLSIIEFGNLSFPLNTHLCQNLFEKSKFENNILFIEGSIKSQNYE